MTGGNTDHYTTAIDVSVYGHLTQLNLFVWLVSDRSGRLRGKCRIKSEAVMLWIEQGRHGIHACFGHGNAGMASRSVLEEEGKHLHACISRESDPGHIDGNGVFYH